MSLPPRSSTGSGESIPYDWNGAYVYPSRNWMNVESNEMGVLGVVPVNTGLPELRIPATIRAWVQMEYDWRGGSAWT